LPTIGFLGNLGSIPNLLTNVTTGRVYVPKLNEVGTLPTEVNSPLATFIGSVGLKNSQQFQKKDMLPAVIGKFLGPHLVMLRYSIIRWIIQKVYNYKTNAEVPILQTSININSTVNDIMTNLEKTVSFEDGNYSFILTLVGRYVDKILVNFIKGLISNQVNAIILESLEQEKIPSHYSEIVRKTLKSTSSIIPVLDMGFSLDLNELFEELISLYYNPVNVNSRRILAFSVGNLQDDQTQPNDIHKILNFNYEINSLEQICYKIDPDVVCILIKNKADVNAKDNLGNSAIYYAIEMQNIEMVRLLLSSGTVVFNKNYRNRIGKSSLEYAWDNYCDIIKTIMSDKYEICRNISKKVLDNFKKKSQYYNNIPKYSKMLLPMALYLLNHQIYILGKGYPNEWTYEINESFERLINIRSDCALPLLETEILDKEIANLDVPGDKADQLKSDIELEESKIGELARQNKNFTKEFTELNSKKLKTKLSENERLRLNELDSDIRQNTIIMNSIKTKVDSYKHQLINLNTSKASSFKILKKYIAKHKNKLQRSGTVVKIYESVFVNVLNSEFNHNLEKGSYDYRIDTKTYAALWKKYFNGILVNDYTQILDLINSYQKSVVEDGTKTIQDKIRDLDIINQYYVNVIVPFSKNYNELPKEYNASNYALTIIIDIITHIVKRIIFSVMFGLITKILVKYVIMTFPNTQNTDIYATDTIYQKYISQLVVGVINDKGNDNMSRLMKYIFDILPLKVVKVILQIYEGDNEGEDDIDRNTTLESLFLHINKIIGSTTVINIQEDSSLLTNLKEYVYPFYIDYIGMFVKEMKLLMDNYLKSLQFQSIGLEILNLLSTKSSSERF
jgi:ankyrin repeat protein